MMSNITKYHNDLNTVRLRKWTPEEMNFLFSILTKAKESGTQLLKFSTEELRSLCDDDFEHKARWARTMERVARKVVELSYVEKSSSKIQVMGLFRIFTVDLDNQTAEIQLDDKFEYILNNLNANFTKFELEEFTKIRSSYAKTLYRYLKQWRTVGRKVFKVDEFRGSLDIPKSYKAGQIDRSIISPSLEQLKPFFKNLKCVKVKERTAGNPIKEYVFTWESEGALYDSEKEYIDQKSAKKIKTTSSNVPAWHNPQYQNNTSADEQQKMEEEKKKLLDKF
ncbi:TPA: replication initiation protein [Streptococcus pyogenes]|nr:replication initiation protein [Streptococcus pyogenes]